MRTALFLATVSIPCLTAAPALCQSKAELADKINSSLPDNSRGQITASGLRGLMNSFNSARGQPNGIAELGADGRLTPAQGQTTFTTGTFLGPLGAPLGSFGALQMKEVSALDKSLAGTSNPDAIMLGVGNQVSFCPAKSCVRGPGGDTVDPAYFDHQRASLLLSSKIQTDAQAQEQTLAVTTTIDKGYVKKYAANTAYALGDNVEVGGGFGGAVYRVTQAGTTGANSAPPNGRPAQGSSFTYTDGTVRFLWINDSAIGAKVGAYFETEIKAGAGSAWGFANNVGIQPGANRAGTATFAFENDFSNNSGMDCPLGSAPCDAIRVGVSGSNKVTTGINIDTNNGNDGAPQNYATLWGIRFSGPKLASESLIALDANGQYGIAANQLGLGGNTFTGALIYDNSASPSFARITGAKSSAVIDDSSNAPVGLLISGTKTLSGVRESSTTPIGVNLVGTYSSAQIQGNGWSVSPAGGLSAASATIGGRAVVTAAGAWTTFTPTGISGGTSFAAGSATGRYRLTDRALFLQIRIPVTAAGSGSATVNVNLPAGFTVASDCVIGGQEFNNVTNKALVARVSSGNGGLTIFNADSTYPGATNSVLVLNGVCEVN